MFIQLIKIEMILSISLLYKGVTILTDINFYSSFKAKLLSLSRTPQNRVEVSQPKSPTIRSPSRSPPVQRKREFPPRPITKMTVPKPVHSDYNQELFQDHQSPETPKPRGNPPKPLSFEFKNKKQQSSNGIFIYLYYTYNKLHVFCHYDISFCSEGKLQRSEIGFHCH